MASNPPQMPEALAKIQQMLQAESEEIKKIEAEYTKVVNGKRSMTEKKSENEMVQQELNLIADGDEATVYKLVGPVLAKQDLSEAKTNVSTRLSYITKEIERMDHLEKEFIGTVEDKKKKCI